MNLITTNTLSFPTEQPNSWQAVRYWTGMSARLKQADLACQVMAGFCLLELHKTHAISQGKRTDLNFPNDSGSSVPTSDLRPPTSPRSWPQIVKAEAGISDDTARNWMAMAKGVKAKWAKLPIRDRLHALMSTPASNWQEQDAVLIRDAVHKVTDGRSQMEFMFELGIARRPIGHALNKNRKTTAPVEPPANGSDPVIAEPLLEEQNEMISGMEHDMHLLSQPDSSILKNCSVAFLKAHQEKADAYSRFLSKLIADREKALQRRVGRIAPSDPGRARSPIAPSVSPSDPGRARSPIAPSSDLVSPSSDL